jgi:hypothetical protein
MGDQDQQDQSAASGQSQQNQAAGQDHGGAQAQPGAADGAGSAAQAAGQSASAASGQQSDTRHTDGGQTGQSTKASQQTETPGIQAGGYKLSLTEAQRKRLLDEGVLEISEEQYTGGVRQHIETLKRRAGTAERRLAEIASAQEETERKALEEQERYKELYEKERQAREAEATARREDTIRSRFLLAAQSKGIVDPDVAYVIAKTLPEFAGVALGEDGAVTGIDAVLDSLTGSKPYLVSQPKEQPKPQSVGTASNPAPQNPPAPKSLAEAGDRLEQALRTGVT